MDERDFRILVDLLRDPTASYESLGRRVGLSGTAVRTRLDRMHEEGPLTGFVGLPRAGLFDRRADVLWFRPEDDVRARLDRALAVDPVVWVDHLHTGEVAVMAYAEPEAPLPRAELEDALGPLVRSAGGYANGATDAAGKDAGPLDWRILRVLVREPRCSVTDLAERTGLTRNTVRRRRDDLYGSGRVALFPLLEAARAPGLVLFNVVVDVADPQVLNDVQGALPHAVLLVRHDPGGFQGATFLGHADTIAEVTLAHEAVQRLPGVQRAKLVVDLARGFATGRVEAWVEERIRETAPR